MPVLLLHLPSPKIEQYVETIFETRTVSERAQIFGGMRLKIPVLPRTAVETVTGTKKMVNAEHDTHSRKDAIKGRTLILIVNFKAQQSAIYKNSLLSPFRY